MNNEFNQVVSSRVRKGMSFRCSLKNQPIQTNNHKNTYIDLARVIHDFLSLWQTQPHNNESPFLKLCEFDELPIPTTFDEHNEFIDLMMEFINTFAYEGVYYFKTALEDSEYSRLRFALHRENENAFLRDQGYVEQPSLLRAGECTNPALDYGAAYLELLELNKLVIAAYLEEMDYPIVHQPLPTKAASLCLKKDNLKNG